MSESPDVDGIAGAYRNYVETFNTGDGAAVARLMGYPVMVGGSGHSPGTIPDEAAYQHMIENTFEHFREKGWVRSQIDRLEAVAAGGDTGVVSAHFSRYRADGTMIENGSGHYVTRRIDGNWKIVAAIMA